MKAPSLLACGVLVLAVALSGCYSVGRKIDQESVAKIQQGKTTKAEVLKLLGWPDSVTRDGLGNEIFMYMYVRSAARPETFVPIVGAFAGGADTQSQMVMVSFDPKGIVSQFTSSMSGMEAGYGASAETPARDMGAVEDNKRPDHSGAKSGKPLDKRVRDESDFAWPSYSDYD